MIGYPSPHGRKDELGSIDIVYTEELSQMAA